MNLDLIFITYAWLVTLVLQLIAAPVLIHFFGKKLFDAGWGLGRILAWLAVCLLVWFPAQLLPVNRPATAYGVVLILAAVSFWVTIKYRRTLLAAIKTKWPLFAIEEILFLLGFFGLSLVRGFNPDILDLEKFMDFGFMASYLRAARLPAPDMWLAGSGINYYSFGHYMGSIMVQLWGIDLTIAYNLLLGLIMGLTFTQAFSVVTNLVYLPTAKTNRRWLTVIAGLIGVLLVGVGGNTHTIWYRLAKGSYDSYWYADATRFIYNTIHEFPSYSFVVSDLHAHVWDLPVVLAFILLALLWYQAVGEAQKSRGYQILAVILGVLYGVMAMTSMWDLMIFGLLITLASGLLLLKNPQLLTRLLISAGHT